MAPGRHLRPKSVFPTFDRLLLLALVIGMIHGRDHHRSRAELPQADRVIRSVVLPVTIRRPAALVRAFDR